MRSILTTKNLCKDYNDVNVLKNINIDIKVGEFVVIMGPSGSGKSTLLNTISGMDNFTSGEVLIDGFDIAKAKEKELQKLRKRDLAFIFQDPNLVSNLTIKENILISGLFTQNYKNEDLKSEVENLLDKVNIKKIENKIPKDVSGGEAERAAIARAVIKKPKILFADEPTGALNSSNSKEVLKLLSELHADGQTIIMVTHSKDAATYGERVIYLEDGNIKAELNLLEFDMKKRQTLLDNWLKELRW